MIYNTYTLSKVSFYLGVAISPGFFIFDVNFGMFEALLIISGVFLLLSNEDLHLPDRWISVSFVLIAIGYSISISNSWDIIEALKFPLQFAFISLVLFPLTITHVSSWHDLYRLTVTLTASLLLICLYGVYYYFTVGVAHSRDRWTLFYANPNSLAWVLFFLTTITLFLLVYERLKNGSDYSYLGLLMLYTVGVLLIVRTLSRSTLIAVMIVVITALVTGFGRQTNLKSIFKRFITMLPMACVPLVIIYYLNLIPEGILIRIEETINYSEDTSTSSRIIQHRIGLRALSEYWLLGTGYNNFNAATHHAVSSAEISYMSENRYPRIHNAWLNPFVEGGILSGIGILILFGTIIKRSIRVYLSKFKPIHLIGYGYLVSTCAYLGTRIFGTLTTLRFYWLMIAISYVVVLLISRDIFPEANRK